MWKWSVWWRIAVIASLAWTGGIVIHSIADTDRSLPLLRGSVHGDYLGPAVGVIIFGIILIRVVCIGIPWIARAAGKN